MTPDASAPVIAYTRVSTDEQGDTGASLDAQEHDLRAYADERGWPVRVVREVASGKSLRNRPLLREALAQLDAGEASGLMAVNLNRVSRSVHDGSGLLLRANRQGWALVILEMGGTALDTTTAPGRMMFNQHLVFAQWWADSISDATKRGLAQRRREGIRLGRPPALEARDVTTRERARAALNQITAHRAAGLSWRQTADALNSAGVPTTAGGEWGYPFIMRFAKRNTNNVTTKGRGDDSRDARVVQPGDGGTDPNAGGEPGAAGGDDFAAVLAHADELDARADSLERAHDELLNAAARGLRDSWSADPTRNYGKIGNGRSSGFNQNDNAYAFNAGNANSWHYVEIEGKRQRRKLPQYRDAYLSIARGDPDAPPLPEGVSAPPETLIADLAEADDLRLVAQSHRRNVSVLQGSDDWAYDDDDRAIARREIDALLSSLV